LFAYWDFLYAKEENLTPTLSKGEGVEFGVSSPWSSLEKRE